MSPRDVDPDELAEALGKAPEAAEPTGTTEAPQGSGIGVAKGRSYGSDAGRIHGTKADPILVGGVGYPYLADLAIGTVIAHRIAREAPEQVAVADLSHTPVASVQTIAEGDHEAVLLVGAQKIGGELNDGEPSEDPGRVRSYPASQLEPMDQEEAVRLVGQGAMGLITVENVIQVGRSLGWLPERTRAITVEPRYDSWGMEIEEFSEPVEAALEDVLEEAWGWIETERARLAGDA